MKHQIEVLLLAITASLAPGALNAQDQPAAFLHGLGGTGDVYQETSLFLADSLQISPIRPNMSWWEYFHIQSDNLHSALSGNNDIPAMAHSNGGLALREYVRRYGGNSRINRAMIVASLHDGAPLAGAFKSGMVTGYLQYALQTIANPFQTYYSADPAFQNLLNHWTMDALIWGVNWVFWFFDNLVTIIHEFIPILDPLAPVSDQMVPGSAFLGTLNSPTATTNEINQLTTRVEVLSSVSPYGVIFRNLTKDVHEWDRVRWLAGHFALTMYSHYRRHPDPYLAANAYLWAHMYFLMYDMDLVWHNMIGTFEEFDALTNTFYAEHSDAVLGISTQEWSSANVSYRLLFPEYDISHREQNDDEDLRLVYLEVFEQHFGVSRRGGTSGGGGGLGDGDDCIPDPNTFQCVHE